MKTRLLARIPWITFQMFAVSEWDFDINLPLSPPLWLAMAAVALFAANAPAALTTNTWSNPASGTWNWATASNWQLALAPAINQCFISITNEAGLTGGIHTRTVTIDTTTVSQPATMTVSNVFISAPGTGIKASHNTLFLDNAGLVTPLNVIGSLGISQNGAVTITNSVLIMGPPPSGSGGGVFVDGALQLQSGSLITTGAYVSCIVGYVGVGQMTVLDGIWQASEVDVGDFSGSQGVLTFAGGVSAMDSMILSLEQGANGTGSVTGGSLTTGLTIIGYDGTGQMTISGGTWLTGDVDIGLFNDEYLGIGQGTLTVAGGTTTIEGSGDIPNGFTIAYDTGTTGFVWMTGGQLITTNASTSVGNAYGGLGQMVVSNGAWQARDVAVGSVGAGGYGFGILKLTGGTTTIYSNLVLGSCANGAAGEVHLLGGTLYVTNAAHTATVDVENGTLTINGDGTLIVDVFIMTNACANFVRAGGILHYGTAILDPNGDADVDGLPNWWEQAHGLDPMDPAGDNGPFGDPDGDGYDNYEEYLAGSDPQNPLSTPLQIIPPPFQITSLQRSGNNIVLTWTTSGGTTNQVQVTNGGSSGVYSTNGFANLGPQMVIGGSGVITTNYTDVGGATNSPARYYRVRLVP